MKKDILTDAEINAVKGIISPQFLADYNQLDAFYTEVNAGSTEPGHTPRILKISPSIKLFQEFKAEMDKEIDKIMNDPVWDDRQKKVMIQQIANEKASQYKQKINAKMADYTEKATQVKEYLAKTVNATEQMTPVQMREMEFVSREMDAESRTALMGAFTPSQVLAIFNKQIDTSKHNQAKARFLHKNAYLHMERINALDADRTEKSRAITEIRKALNHLEKYAYTPGQIGLKKMVHNSATFNRTGVEGIRAIDNWMKVYTR